MNRTFSYSALVTMMTPDSYSSNSIPDKRKSHGAESGYIRNWSTSASIHTVKVRSVRTFASVWIFPSTRAQVGWSGPGTVDTKLRRSSKSGNALLLQETCSVGHRLVV